MLVPRHRRRALTISALGALVLAGVWWQQTDESRPGSAESFIAWARPRAIPILSVEAGGSFDDLRPLAAIVGRAPIVGIGEATHGTREFFQFKVRMLEFLVNEMGFTAFAMETDFANAMRVDAYVRGGEGDAAAVVRDMGYWIWNTEEIVALVQWMRQHNLKPTTARKVRFYGFDMQSPATATVELVKYLAAADAAEVRPFATLPARAAALRALRPEHQAARTEVMASVRRLIECLEKNRVRFVRATGDEAWRWARQHADVALQAVALNGSGDHTHRDASMAKNIQWILDREGAVGRIMVWAHNGHVMHRIGILRDWLPLDYVPMGRRLRMRMGEEYVAVGLAFSQGGVRNMRKKSTTLGPAAPETFDGVLARVGPPVFALDLRSAPADPEAARWLRAPHLTRFFGLNESANAVEDFSMADCYDAVVFFDRTTAARANPE